MNWFRRQRFLVIRWALFLSVLTQLGAPARALQPFPGMMNNLMTYSIESRALRMGFVATDPRIAATVRGMGAAAAGIGEEVAVGAVAGTAMTWGAVILGGVIIGAGIYYLASDHQNSVQCDSLTSCVMALLSGSGHPTLSPGGAYWSTVAVFNTTVQCSDPSGCAQFVIASKQSATTSATIALGAGTMNSANTQITYAWTSTNKTSGSVTNGTAFAVTKATGTYTGPECGSGVFTKVGSDASTAKCFDLSPNPVHSNPLALPDALAPSELAKPMDPSLAALTANKLWQTAAAQPGYAGIPYSMTDPITAAEMQQIKDTRPDLWPSVGDLTAPIAQGAQTGSPMPTVPMPANGPKTATQPGYVPEPATGTNPSTQPLSNLGPDPATPAPNVGTDTPTAQSIVDPLFDWFPNIGGMSLSVPSGTCPTDTLDIWDHHLVLDQHCDFFEQYRSLIAAAMLAVWTMAAAVVLLRA